MQNEPHETNGSPLEQDAAANIAHECNHLGYLEEFLQHMTTNPRHAAAIVKTAAEQQAVIDRVLKRVAPRSTDEVTQALVKHFWERERPLEGNLHMTVAFEAASVVIPMFQALLAENEDLKRRLEDPGANRKQ